MCSLLSESICIAIHKQFSNNMLTKCFIFSLFYSSLQLELHKKNLTFLKFHAQRKRLYQLIKIQLRKLVGSKRDTTQACLRKRINTFLQGRIETKTLHKEYRYWDLDIDFDCNIFKILLVWPASMLWQATLRYKQHNPSHK